MDPRAPVSSSSNNGTPADTPPLTLKRRRITRACDRCHKGGIKCAASKDPDVCLPCASFGSECTYDRPIKRRGPAARRLKDVEGLERGNGLEEQDGSPSDVPAPRRKARRVEDEGIWRAEHVASSEVIEHLVEGYLRIVYPILPYFHWPTFSYDVRRRRYLHDRPFFAATMAVCAMSCARQRDGAKIPNFDTTLNPDIPPSQVFYNAAVNAFPKGNLLEASDFDYKRAKALLTMISIQYGRVTEVKLHLGELCTMCSLEGFHSESRWPPGLNAIEVEERRRLFWAIYQLDIYASIIWGMMVSHRESQITVGYPTEVYEDEEITPSGFLPRRPGKGVSFLRGWNFVCDLYRVIEHATDRLRANRIGGSALDDVTGLYSRKGGPDPSEVLGVVAKLYNQLPMDFKRVNAMTGDLEKDRYGFTTTNIIITLQTLRSVVAGSEEANVHQRCTIAAEMLDAFASVPVSYIQAGSAPMLHHLAGVGHLLGSIIQSPLSQHSYLRVRTVLLALADMLATLESALSNAPDIALRLRAHVSRIDNYMTEAALQQQHQVQIPMSLPARSDAHPYLPSLLNFHAPPSDVRTEALKRPQSTQFPHTPAAGSTATTSTTNLAEQMSSLEGVIGQPSIGASPNPADWEPPVDVSPAVEFQIPDDLFSDWPFDFGQGDVFDWLGEVQAQQGQPAPAPAPEGFDFGTSASTGGSGWDAQERTEDHVL